MDTLGGGGGTEMFPQIIIYFLKLIQINYETMAINYIGRNHKHEDVFIIYKAIRKSPIRAL